MNIFNCLKWNITYTFFSKNIYIDERLDIYFTKNVFKKIANIFPIDKHYTLLEFKQKNRKLNK